MELWERNILNKKMDEYLPIILTGDPRSLSQNQGKADIFDAENEETWITEDPEGSYHKAGA